MNGHPGNERIDRLIQADFTTTHGVGKQQRGENFGDRTDLKQCPVTRGGPGEACPADTLRHLCVADNGRHSHADVPRGEAGSVLVHYPREVVLRADKLLLLGVSK